ncbi:hypothetical protein [Cylindrospermum sp. FACHB-282]|uniref:hypothetical protein n=1 Tax=Cylindrospermum sp. FACHB-282 TaxID=2692794 RepID=UPI001682D8E7|nr:hypothetical protein [Cylindrospermum sp. FACHB-282]MBD2385077.1 hypothetical protein [Cylindrospermum sp. FACHB-282]
MADIKINDIQPAGLELFADVESFMHQLTDNEMMGIVGGKIYPIYNTKTVVISYIQVETK